MPFSYSFPFFFGGPPPTTDANGCWIGLPSPFELQLLTPLPTYALEQLRQRFLYALTTTHDPVKSARVLFQMAFETEIRTVLVKMISLPASVPESKVCERRHFIDVDADMQSYRFLVGPALDELGAVPAMPEPYMDLLRRYASADYARYRMCSVAAALSLAAFLLSS